MMNKQELYESFTRAFNVESASKTIEALTGMTIEQVVEDIKEGKLVPKEGLSEVLSQEWISDNAVVGQYPIGIGHVVPAYKLQNLLVPKQGLPVVPKFVADWIKEEQGTMSNWKLPSRFISDSKYKKDQRRYKWSQVEGNMDKFMSALINSYEVEEEPLYYALVKGHELFSDSFKYWTCKSYNLGYLFIGSKYLKASSINRMTKNDWDKLGIDDSNADFVKVDE